MKKFRVIKYFTDLQDNGHAYHEGDPFPREGLTVSEERFAELASSENRRKQPLIEAIEDPVEDIPEENAGEAKEEPLAVKTGESSTKTTKAKRSAKKK